MGTDASEEAIKTARYHAELAGVAQNILFMRQDFRNLTSSLEYGCVICNPPYADADNGRNSQRSDVRRLRFPLQKSASRKNGREFSNRSDFHYNEQYRPLYESFPAVLSKLPSWSHFIYTACNDFEKIIGQDATRRRKLYNGRTECTYFQFLGPRPPKQFNIFTTETPANENLHPGYQNTVDRVQNRNVLPDSEEHRLEKDTPPSDKSTSNESVSNEFVKADATFPGVQPVFAGLDDYSVYQIEEFGKCLKNRQRHLARYPKRGITSYRIYDRDFPEVPLVIDLLEGEYLHVAEYERPDKRSVGQHRLWMDKLIEKAGEILKIPQNQIFFKRRRPQRGSSQYEKLSESGKMIIVREGGLKFLCNLTDYLDIGLFLDHRLTREMVRRESQGRRFLNLFCYTGSFTCYAAAGGAASTVSVDLSPTYLDWAQENMEENGFYDRSRDGKTEHRYIKADVLNFLQSIPPATGRSEKTGDKSSCRYGINRSDFELCVCDPPTFSNSKSTKKDWDVQQQHVELLRSLATRMVSGGVVYFSNNFRRFKLDEDHLTDIYQIREITNRTIPEEFRNKKIHHCWRLVVR